MMRATAFVFALALLVSGTAAAQEWDEYTNVNDGFKINFPGQPSVAEKTWTSQMNYTLPMRVYSAEKGRERYSLTVVDYSGIEQLGIERAKTCPPGNANCRANAPPALGPGYSHHDERGAIVYATFHTMPDSRTVESLGTSTAERRDFVPAPITSTRGMARMASASSVDVQGLVTVRICREPFGPPCLGSRPAG